MSTVKFNVVEEFCQEIENDAPDIDRRIVRATNLFRTSSMSPKIRHILVVATYSIGGEIVQLEHYCGEVWGINAESDRKVRDRAEETHKAIKRTAQALGLQVRSGSFEA